MQLKEMVATSDNIVFFGGAGVSTESGIPDFRSVDGLYHQKFRYPPETILSHTFYERHKEEFFDFYRQKLIAPKARPNAAHVKLAQWERDGKLKLSSPRTSTGCTRWPGATRCWSSTAASTGTLPAVREIYGLEHILRTEGVPRCSCGGIIKPDVVLYEEGLDQGTLEAAVRALAEADMLMIGGTSLNVYPAAGLIRYYQGHRLVLLNKSPVARDLAADLVITDQSARPWPSCEALRAGVFSSPPRLPVAFEFASSKKKNSKNFLFFQKYFSKRLKMQFF